jgi:hypothetical protein
MFPTNAFQPIFKFTDGDLTYSRQGQLSPAQVDALKRADRSSSYGTLGCLGFVFVILTVIIVVVGGAFLSNVRLSDPGAIGGLIGLAVPVLFWIVCTIAILFTLRGALSPKTPTLGRSIGPVVPGNQTDDRTNYEIEINGKSLEIPEAAYRMIDPAKTYAIYTAVYGKDDDKRIVAIEENPTGAALYGSKSPAEYEKEHLQSIYQFNDNDLAANRAGRLSPEQAVRLSKDIGSGFGTGCFFGVFLGIFPLVFIGAFTQNVLMAVGITALVFGVCVLISMRSAKGQQRKLASATVTKAHGMTFVNIRKVRHTGKNSYTETIYTVEIGDTKFTVEENAYYAFKEGAVYNVFYVPELDGQPIISAEQLG